MDLRAHDLLWIDRPEAFLPCAERPAWLDGWLAAAPLVVRRDVAPAGRAPAGARGLLRNQRCAGQVEAGAVVRRVTPAQLASAVREDTGRLAAAARDLPCVAALLALAPRLDALGLEWGPTGGVGFWLASGLPVLRPASDLDLLVRAPARLHPDAVAALCALRDGAPCRLDIQVDTGIGGFALSEYAGGAARVLLKTARGPHLLADPWAALDAA